MNASTPFEADADGCACCEVARAEMKARHQAMLRELAEIGMALARDLRGLDVKAATPQMARDVGLAFSRVSKAVRLTMALEVRFEEGPVAPRARAAGRVDEAPPRAALEPLRVDTAAVARRIHRELLQEIVGDAIRADAAECAERDVPFDAEEVLRELDEKIETEWKDAWFNVDTFGATLAQVCRELGVVWDPSIWENDEDGGRAKAIRDHFKAAKVWAKAEYAAGRWPPKPDARMPTGP